jgi:hypothetical protein
MKLKMPGLKKPKIKRINIKSIKKRNLLVLLAALLILAVLAGAGITKEVFKEKAPEKKIEAPAEDKSSETKKAPEIDMKGLENHLGTDFVRTLKTGTYMIRYTTRASYGGKSYEVESTFAVSGDKTTMASADRATIVKEGKAYLLNHTDKSVISWNVDSSKGGLKKIDTDGMTFSGSSKVGDLVCEEYQTSASYLKLYFKGAALVKIETKINDQDLAMEVVSISGEVPESMFQVPADYRVTNI